MFYSLRTSARPPIEDGFYISELGFSPKEKRKKYFEISKERIHEPLNGKEWRLIKLGVREGVTFRLFPSSGG